MLIDIQFGRLRAGSGRGNPQNFRLRFTRKWLNPSLVPRPSPAPVFDRLQYAKTEPEGLVNLTT